jgi:DNA topoisomerase-1
MQINQDKLKFNKSIKQNDFLVHKMKPSEQLLNVTFITSGTNGLINYQLICKNTELFVRLEERFYNDFEPKVEIAFKEMEKKAPVETGDMCPKCGSPLVIKQSRYGKFVACSNYPECKYIQNNDTEREEVVIMDCPNCDGKIVEKKTKRGKVFYGCNNFPKCKTATWDKPTGNMCPKCKKGLLVSAKSGIKCSSCDYKEE